MAKDIEDLCFLSDFSESSLDNVSQSSEISSERYSFLASLEYRVLAATNIELAPGSVSYTHLTLPTN